MKQAIASFILNSWPVRWASNYGAQQVVTHTTTQRITIAGLDPNVLFEGDQIQKLFDALNAKPNTNNSDGDDDE